MSPILVCLIALGALLAGYLVYARFLEQRIFGLTDDEDVPSVRLRDDVDFAPTPRNILWGHHFASIAGAAPILGPAMAIVWGWLPALLWIVVGVVFMGAAHDFGALVLSLRHEAKSVGALTQMFIGPRSRLLFLVVIFFLIWLVSAVFAFAIGGLFVKFPASILPVNLEIVVAVGLGLWVYRYQRALFVPSLLALVGLYAVMFGTASDVLYVPGPESLLRDLDFWLIALMLYAFVASSLPVWVLLQPRDLINSHQLVVGLVALFAGFFVSSPTFHAPAVGPLEDLPALFPLLFVTVACGAISGFHGLVSSGTTSKQLLHPRDARPIGYGAMLAEASLAILSTLAVATGMMVSGDDHVWHAVYEPIVAAKTLPEVPQALGGFVNGAATMLVALGLEGQVASTIVAVLVISFAATSLDTALRIQRLILGEIGEMFGWKALSNRWLAGTIACGSVLVLIYGDKAQGAKSLWPVFGATNQVFAAITLLLCALYLRGNKRSAWPYLAPAVVVMLLTFSAMAVQVLHDIAHGQWLVGTAGAVIAILTGWVALEGAFAWRRAGRAGGDVTSRD